MQPPTVRAVIVAVLVVILAGLAVAGRVSGLAPASASASASGQPGCETAGSEADATVVDDTGTTDAGQDPTTTTSTTTTSTTGDTTTTSTTEDPTTSTVADCTSTTMGGGGTTTTLPQEPGTTTTLSGGGATSITVAEPTITSGQPTNTTAAAPSTTAPQGPTVAIVDLGFRAVQELSIGSFQDAFDLDPLALKGNFIDLDVERFHVQVGDANANRDPNTAEQVSITLATDSPGVAYDDPPDVIELGEVEPATGQPATNTGMFRSRSLLLVPDDTDDDHPVDGVTDGLRNDRTHIVALGGEVIVSYSTRTVRARVPVRRQLPVHVTVLTDADNQPLIGEKFVDQALGGTPNSRYDAGEPFRDVDGNGAYTPRLSQAGATLRVNEDLGYANEIYGQAGIRVRLVALQFRVAPAALASGRIVLSPTVDPRTNERRPIVGDQNLTATEKALLRTERARPQDGFNSPDPNDIEVYFLPLIELGDFPAAGGLPAITSSGVAFSELPRDPMGGYKGMRTPDVNDSLVVSDKSSFEVLAHEMLHIVGEPHHDQRPNLMFANAFAKVDRDQFAVTDSKRITLLQGVAARSSAYTLGP